MIDRSPRGAGSAALARWSVLVSFAVGLSACVDHSDASSSSTDIAKPAASENVTTDTARLGAAQASAARMEVAPGVERACRQICDRSRQLNCNSVDKCLPNCMAMGSATPCTNEIQDFYRCLVGQPVQNWECAPDGVAAIRAGFCDSEQGRTVVCMETKMR
jgi:hypothetical protein